MNLKRKYYIIRCRIHVLLDHFIEGVLHILSKVGLIVEHKKSYTNVFDQGEPHSAPDIKSERFVFSVSYLIRKVEFVSEYWFETKHGKRIYTVYENHHEENRISYRADLKSFFCHFSHRHRQWVHKESPRIYVKKEKFLSPTLNDKYGIECYTCDFSKCRYALEFSIAPDALRNTAEEVISKSYKVLGDSLTSKIPEINKMLTGAENDGNLTSPKKCPLADNLVCRKCGFPVFATPTGRYIYECIHHGEIEYRDVDRVDPKKYEGILTNCMFELERFCECPQDNTFRC